MGAYLGTPNTTKTSHDETHDNLDFGLSGMQGWRMSMEDAYCCLPDIDDKNNSLFGVFDGHGGKEVAEYCAQNLHKFLLDIDAYNEGDVKTALSKAFMAIDEAITSDEVIAELKVLSDCVESDQDEEDEAAMLMEEANMPIEELLQRFKGNVKEKLIENGILQNDEEENVTEADEIKKVQTSGHVDTNESNGSFRSRKQTKPVKRNLDESNEEKNNVINPTTNKPTNDEVKTNSNSSSSQSSSNDADVATADGSAPLTTSSSGSSGASSSSEPSNATSDSELGDVSCSSGQNSVSSSNRPTSIPLVQNQYDDDDDDGDDDDDDDEEEDNEVEKEECSSDDDDDDEFEDSEGVHFQPPVSDEVGKESGTTAVVALLHQNKLYVANAGDSRCVLCRYGKAIEMSFDHKPEDEIEKNRIEKAGGTITMDGRVNGGLNLSRAIGDHAYKQNKNIPLEEQAISALPDIKEIDLTNEDSFMVLACDGIWNVMSSEEVIEFINTRLTSNSEEKPMLSKICEDLMDSCLASNTDNDGSGCDNMTCVIVRFKHDTDRIVSGSNKRTIDSETNDSGKSSKRPKLSAEY